MERHPDFAFPIAIPLWIETQIDRPDGDGFIQGWAIALGWNRPDQVEASGAPPPGRDTLYLVSDTEARRPLWIKARFITANRVSSSMAGAPPV